MKTNKIFMPSFVNKAVSLVSALIFLTTQVFWTAPAVMAVEQDGTLPTGEKTGKFMGVNKVEAQGKNAQSKLETMKMAEKLAAQSAAKLKDFAAQVKTKRANVSGGAQATAAAKVSGQGAPTKGVDRETALRILKAGGKGMDAPATTSGTAQLTQTTGTSTLTLTGTSSTSAASTATTPIGTKQAVSTAADTTAQFTNPNGLKYVAGFKSLDPSVNTAMSAYVNIDLKKLNNDKTPTVLSATANTMGTMDNIDKTSKALAKDTLVLDETSAGKVTIERSVVANAIQESGRVTNVTTGFKDHIEVGVPTQGAAGDAFAPTFSAQARITIDIEYEKTDQGVRETGITAKRDGMTVENPTQDPEIAQLLKDFRPPTMAETAVPATDMQGEMQDLLSYAGTDAGDFISYLDILPDEDIARALEEYRTTGANSDFVTGLIDELIAAYEVPVTEIELTMLESVSLSYPGYQNLAAQDDFSQTIDALSIIDIFIKKVSAMEATAMASSRVAPPPPSEPVLTGERMTEKVGDIETGYYMVNGQKLVADVTEFMPGSTTAYKSYTKNYYGKDSLGNIVLTDSKKEYFKDGDWTKVDRRVTTIYQNGAVKDSQDARYTWDAGQQICTGLIHDFTDINGVVTRTEDQYEYFAPGSFSKHTTITYEVPWGSGGVDALVKTGEVVRTYQANNKYVAQSVDEYRIENAGTGQEKKVLAKRTTVDFSQEGNPVAKHETDYGGSYHGKTFISTTNYTMGNAWEKQGKTDFYVDTDGHTIGVQIVSTWDGQKFVEQPLTTGPNGGTLSRDGYYWVETYSSGGKEYQITYMDSFMTQKGTERISDANEIIEKEYGWDGKVYEITLMDPRNNERLKEKTAFRYNEDGRESGKSFKNYEYGTNGKLIRETETEYIVSEGGGESIEYVKNKELITEYNTEGTRITTTTVKTYKDRQVDAEDITYYGDGAQPEKDFGQWSGDELKNWVKNMDEIRLGYVFYEGGMYDHLSEADKSLVIQKFQGCPDKFRDFQNSVEFFGIPEGPATWSPNPADVKLAGNALADALDIFVKDPFIKQTVPALANRAQKIIDQLRNPGTKPPIMLHIQDMGAEKISQIRDLRDIVKSEIKKQNISQADYQHPLNVIHDRLGYAVTDWEYMTEYPEDAHYYVEYANQHLNSALTLARDAGIGQALIDAIAGFDGIDSTEKKEYVYKGERVEKETLTQKTKEGYKDRVIERVFDPDSPMQTVFGGKLLTETTTLYSKDASDTVLGTTTNAYAYQDNGRIAWTVQTIARIGEPVSTVISVHVPDPHDPEKVIPKTTGLHGGTLSIENGQLKETTRGPGSQQIYYYNNNDTANPVKDEMVRLGAGGTVINKTVTEYGPNNTRTITDIVSSPPSTTVYTVQLDGNVPPRPVRINSDGLQIYLTYEGTSGIPVRITKATTVTNSDGSTTTTVEVRDNNHPGSPSGYATVGGSLYSVQVSGLLSQLGIASTTVTTRNNNGVRTLETATIYDTLGGRPTTIETQFDTADRPTIETRTVYPPGGPVQPGDNTIKPDKVVTVVTYVPGTDTPAGKIETGTKNGVEVSLKNYSYDATLNPPRYKITAETYTENGQGQTTIKTDVKYNNDGTPKGKTVTTTDKDGHATVQNFTFVLNPGTGQLDEKPLGPKGGILEQVRGGGFKETITQANGQTEIIYDKDMNKTQETVTTRGLWLTIAQIEKVNQYANGVVVGMSERHTLKNGNIQVYEIEYLDAARTKLVQRSVTEFDKNNNKLTEDVLTYDVNGAYAGKTSHKYIYDSSNKPVKKIVAEVDKTGKPKSPSQEIPWDPAANDYKVPGFAAAAASSAAPRFEIITGSSGMPQGGSSAGGTTNAQATSVTSGSGTSTAGGSSSAPQSGSSGGTTNAQATSVTSGSGTPTAGGSSSAPQGGSSSNGTAILLTNAADASQGGHPPLMDWNKAEAWEVSYNVGNEGVTKEWINSIIHQSNDNTMLSGIKTLQINTSTSSDTIQYANMVGTAELDSTGQVFINTLYVIDSTGKPFGEIILKGELMPDKSTKWFNMTVRKYDNNIPAAANAAVALLNYSKNSANTIKSTNTSDNNSTINNNPTDKNQSGNTANNADQPKRTDAGDDVWTAAVEGELKPGSLNYNNNAALKKVLEETLGADLATVVGPTTNGNKEMIQFTIKGTNVVVTVERYYESSQVKDVIGYTQNSVFTQIKNYYDKSTGAVKEIEIQEGSGTRRLFFNGSLEVNANKDDYNVINGKYFWQTGILPDMQPEISRLQGICQKYSKLRLLPGAVTPGEGTTHTSGQADLQIALAKTFLSRPNPDYNAIITSTINKALELDPNNYQGLLLRADTYMKAGKLREAIADAQKCVQQNPNDERSYSIIADSNLILARGESDPLQKLTYYVRAIDTYYNNVLNIVKTNSAVDRATVSVVLGHIAECFTGTRDTVYANFVNGKIRELEQGAPPVQVVLDVLAGPRDNQSAADTTSNSKPAVPIDFTKMGYPAGFVPLDPAVNPAMRTYLDTLGAANIQAKPYSADKQVLNFSMGSTTVELQRMVENGTMKDFAYINRGGSQFMLRVRRDANGAPTETFIDGGSAGYVYLDGQGTVKDKWIPGAGDVGTATALLINLAKELTPPAAAVTAPGSGNAQSSSGGNNANVNTQLSLNAGINPAIVPAPGAKAAYTPAEILTQMKTLAATTTDGGLKTVTVRGENVQFVSMYIVSDSSQQDTYHLFDAAGKPVMQVGVRYTGQSHAGVMELSVTAYYPGTGESRSVQSYSYATGAEIKTGEILYEREIGKGKQKLAENNFAGLVLGAGATPEDIRAFNNFIQARFKQDANADFFRSVQDLRQSPPKTDMHGQFKLGDERVTCDFGPAGDSVIRLLKQDGSYDNNGKEYITNEFSKWRASLLQGNDLKSVLDVTDHNLTGGQLTRNTQYTSAQIQEGMAQEIEAAARNGQPCHILTFDQNLNLTNAADVGVLKNISADMKDKLLSFIGKALQNKTDQVRDAAVFSNVGFGIATIPGGYKMNASQVGSGDAQEIMLVYFVSGAQQPTVTTTVPATTTSSPVVTNTPTSVMTPPTTVQTPTPVVTNLTTGNTPGYTPVSTNLNVQFAENTTIRNYVSKLGATLTSSGPGSNYSYSSRDDSVSYSPADGTYLIQSATDGKGYLFTFDGTDDTERSSGLVFNRKYEMSYNAQSNTWDVKKILYRGTKAVASSWREETSWTCSLDQLGTKDGVTDATKQALEKMKQAAIESGLFTQK